MLSPDRLPQLAPTVEAYLTSVGRACDEHSGTVVSLVLFGSVAVGGYSSVTSDVDLLVILRDGATPQHRNRVDERVSAIEERCGVTKRRSYRQGALDKLMDRITANTRTFFICTRSDLLSGDPARILDISPVQARFVDRIVMASVMLSAITVWGEELLAQVPLLPIRRFDVGKAFFGLFCQVLSSAMSYPILPGATKYAMEALKRSVHNCYFCYHGRRAPLAEEVAFFQQRNGPNHTLARLLLLRN